jgi:hypothetical protein
LVCAYGPASVRPAEAIAHTVAIANSAFFILIFVCSVGIFGVSHIPLPLGQFRSSPLARDRSAAFTILSIILIVTEQNKWAKAW